MILAQLDILTAAEKGPIYVLSVAFLYMIYQVITFTKKFRERELKQQETIALQQIEVQKEHNRGQKITNLMIANLKSHLTMVHVSMMGLNIEHISDIEGRDLKCTEVLKQIEAQDKILIQELSKGI